MKKILYLFFFPFFAFSQLSKEFIELKPSFTKYEIFNYTGSIQSWTVPAGVTQIYIDVLGAQGGSSSPNEGGKGGKVTCYLNVSPSDVLYITVGGMSNSQTAVYGFGGNGGSSTSYGISAKAGGGLSGVSTANPITQSNALLIAAGGGGTPSSPYAGSGGAGGGLNGLNGASVYGGTNTRGGGASQSAGGAAGSSVDVNSTSPTAGTVLNGGNGGIVSGLSPGWNGGGGGGAGYFGGGGGAGGGNAQGSGGGGSSWTHSSCISPQNIGNINSGNGKVIIYYN
jgi:hypothetical protein